MEVHEDEFGHGRDRMDGMKKISGAGVDGSFIYGIMNMPHHGQRGTSISTIPDKDVDRRSNPGGRSRMNEKGPESVGSRSKDPENPKDPKRQSTPASSLPGRIPHLQRIFIVIYVITMVFYIFFYYLLKGDFFNLNSVESEYRPIEIATRLAVLLIFLLAVIHLFQIRKGHRDFRLVGLMVVVGLMLVFLENNWDATLREPLVGRFFLAGFLGGSLLYFLYRLLKTVLILWQALLKY